ncbi:MAG TPA: hypothetical protein P5080_03535 [Candidatus Paceibacterota bacterium]|nr:hypothetical protein [Candidatus Paceibacterota bacterium]HSA36758.1 hypothetical protein [Candidatus Paceibacterota bacterium]
MGEEIPEESKTSGDTVLYTRYADGRISLNPMMVERDAKSSAEFLAQWLERAGTFKEKAAASSLASKEFIDELRFEAAMTAAFLGTSWAERLPENLMLAVMFVKSLLAYLRKVRLEKKLVKEAAAGKEMILFARFREMPDWSWKEQTMVVSVGVTAYPLAAGYSFKGKDKTGRFKTSEDIERKVAEWVCPMVIYWPWEQQKLLDGVAEDDLTEIIFPLVVMREMAAELKRNNAGFKAMLIYESQTGRQTLDLERGTLSQLGIE